MIIAEIPYLVIVMCSAHICSVNFMYMESFVPKDSNVCLPRPAGGEVKKCGSCISYYNGAGYGCYTLLYLYHSKKDKYSRYHGQVGKQQLNSHRKLQGNMYGVEFLVHWTTALDIKYAMETKVILRKNK